VPSFAREVLRAVVRTGATLGALDHVLLAGEALPGELADALRTALPAARLVNLYGPTESILATWHEVTTAQHGPVPIGRAIPGRQVLVVDDRDRPCPTGVTGHLVIRGPHLTPGYTGQAAGERAAFTPLRDEPGPCYRTGDLARRRWDGLLEFRGRKDFQVKFYGTRVELTDLEAALAADDSVAECAVTALTNAEGLVTKLVAYVVPARGADGQALGSTEDWRAVLARRFGRAKFPVTFQTMIGLPRNLGGKVDRRGLPAPATPTRARPKPPSATARVVTAIWSDLLGTRATADSFAADFFAAGGHSLLAPQLLGRVRERLGVAVSLWDFLTSPTIAGLTALIDSQAAEQADTEPMIG
jgi:acyl-coenzyme A synthetase/AMP-(fatty) acid ligase